MMKKVACLTTVVAWTISVTTAAAASVVAAATTSGDHDTLRQRRMKKEYSSRTTSSTARHKPHHGASSATTTTSRNESPRHPTTETQRHEQTNDWYDDYFDYFDDDQSEMVRPENDDDQYYTDDAVDDDDDLAFMGDDDDAYYHHNHHHQGKGHKVGKKSSKKSAKKSSKKGKKGGLLNDDFYGNDDFFAPGQPRPTMLLEARAASPPALLSIPIGGSTDPRTVGTIYPFGNTTYNADAWGDILVPVSIEKEMLLVNIRLDGYCTRTGTSDNTVEGYCHFSYTAVDPEQQFTIGQLTVEGPLANPNVMENNPCSALAVTGGTGFMTGAGGMVQFCPSVLNDIFTPPVVSSLPMGADLFEDAQGYEHIFTVLLDEEFAFVTPVVVE